MSYTKTKLLADGLVGHSSLVPGLFWKLDFYSQWDFFPRLNKRLIIVYVYNLAPDVLKQVFVLAHGDQVRFEWKKNIGVIYTNKELRSGVRVTDWLVCYLCDT